MVESRGVALSIFLGFALLSGAVYFKPTDYDACKRGMDATYPNTSDRALVIAMQCSKP
jgi:hypothetical protein